MCDYPLLAFDMGVKPDGKRAIKFLSRYDMSFKDAQDKYGEHLLLLPCGHCPSCVKMYAKTWSVRLMLESLYHSEMCFVTLTFDNYHLPKDVAGVKFEFQKFLKRLREKFDDRKIRYFGCIERGGQTKRLHVHFILFGVSFNDAKVFGYNELKQPCYTSKVLSDLWPLGFSSFGEVTPESCAYVARYSMKKKLDFSHDDSCLMMSTHPGIGTQFYLDKKEILYLSDRVYSSSFHGVSIPRYFDKLAENDPIVSDMFQKSKEKRLKRGQQLLYNFLITSGSDTFEIANKRKIEDNLKKLYLRRRDL